MAEGGKSSHSADSHPANPSSHSDIATLAKGESVGQTFINSSIKVDSGDHVYGDKIVYNLYSMAPTNVSDQFQKPSLPSSHEVDSFKNAPVGEGWKRLTETLYFNNKRPIKEGANVFEGRQYLTQSWCEVAIKIVYCIHIRKESYEEVAILRKLEHHPNVIKVYDAKVMEQETLPFIYISMPRCPKTLNDVINESDQKKFNFDEFGSYAEQIVEGAAFIHDKGIQHRDIKPENILIAVEGHCLISDFGLSKEIQDGQITVTISEPIVGTEGYQAPEIHEKPPRYSYRSDSFSIGVVLSMLFSCGAHPYDGPIPDFRRINIMQNKEPDLTSVKKNMHPYPEKQKQLLRLIRKLLSHDPKNRPLPKEMLHGPFFKVKSCSIYLQDISHEYDDSSTTEVDIGAESLATGTENPEEENSLMSSWKGNSPGYNVPQYGWRIALSHRFPPKKRTAWMLPFKYQNHAHLGLAHRYLPFHRRLKKINRRPCIDYFDQQTFEQIYGVPAGGIGGGTFNRGWRGEFCRWQLRPGIYENVTSSANQFIVCIRRNGETIYQKVLSPDSCLQNDLKSWVWDFPADQAFYHALYPRAWTVYEIPHLGLVLTCRQISPVIPHEYKDSSIPAVVFSWCIQNNSDRHYQVTIALAMENGIGTKAARLAKGNYNQQFDSDGNFTGVTMHNTYFDKMPYTMTLGGRQADDKNVSKCLNFDPASDGSSLWDDLFKDGDFDCTDTVSNRTVSGQALGCALAIRSSVNAKSTAEGLDFALSWDMPVVNFGSKEFSYCRRYTRYFGSDGKAGHQIAIYALNNYRNWEEQIERWQNPILSNSNLPNWYKSALFNELYYITDGGTIWLEIPKAGVSSDNQAQNSSSSVTKEYIRNSSIIQEYGRFAYLEGHEYRMFNTYDSHFHASIALAHLWPNLELSLQYDIAASILQTDDTSFQFFMDGNNGFVKSPDVVPHDLGDPEDEPWQRVNAYFIHDTAYWIDLNPKFVLQVFRDYYITKNIEFLKDMWPVCLNVMVTSMKYDLDGDGLIENNGTADQTLYWWSMSGPSAYCGGLWLGALRCILQAGKILDRENEVKQYEEILKIAAKSYQDKLWNGDYFNYCSDRRTKHWDSIMADQCVAQWYLSACDIADVLPPEQVSSSLKTVYEFNVQAFADGKRGAVNGMRPNREIDQSCMQSQEVWSGVTYALAATMIHNGMVDEGFKTAEGIYKSIWEVLGMAFQTPAASLKHNHYRSLGYMRSLSIWGMQYALEHIDAKIPSATKSVKIGINGGRIEVAGSCVVFEPGTFVDVQTITVTAKLDPQKWPLGNQAVTCTLQIEAKNLQKEATVQLHTWLVSDNECSDVDVMCYKKHIKKWEVLTTCSVGDSEFIEFQTQHFCSLVAFVRNKFCRFFRMRPIINFHADDFVLALVQDTPLKIQQLANVLKKDHRNDLETRTLMAIKCEKEKNVECCIEAIPNHFQFLDSATFTHDIKSIIEDNMMSYNRCRLERNSDHPSTSNQATMPKTIQITLRVAGEKLRKPDCFSYKQPRPVTALGADTPRQLVQESRQGSNNAETIRDEQTPLSEDVKEESDKYTEDPGLKGKLKVGSSIDNPSRSGVSNRGEHSEKSENKLTIIRGSTGQQGMTAGHITEDSGKSTHINKDGTDIIGATGEDVKIVVDALAGNKVNVAIKYSDGSPKFEGRYRLDQTIYDVLADMRERSKKDIDFIRSNESENALHKDTGLATLHLNGRLYTLTAVLSEKRLGYMSKQA